MKKEVKIALIGAGSLAFTPSLLKGLTLSALSDECKLTVALMDIDPEILGMMYEIGKKLQDHLRKKGKAESLKIEKYTDRKSALRDADFVTVTISVGGTEATHLDVQIPKEMGIIQSIGDTVGPAGIFRSFRHVPVVLDIARDMEDLCPEAILCNYTNPLTPLTRVVLRETKIRCYGLCSGPGSARPALARAFDSMPEDVEVYVVGINHLYWVKDFKVKGQDGYTLLKEKLARGETPKIDPVHLQLYKIFGILPSVGIGHHVSEFFPSLFMHQKAVEQYKIPLYLKGTIYDYGVREQVHKMLNGILSGERTVESLEEGEEATAITLMEAMVLDKRAIFPGINVPNDGIVPNIQSWGILEVPAYIDSLGVHPLSMGQIPKGVAAVLSNRLNQYEVTIDAALTGDRSMALQSLLMDGYVQNIEVAEKLLEKLLEAEKKWIPPYWFNS
ncbi:MAG: family 4 glycosyl hydrolase [Thermoproteota archaeon]